MIKVWYRQILLSGFAYGHLYFEGREVNSYKFFYSGKKAHGHYPYSPLVRLIKAYFMQQFSGRTGTGVRFYRKIRAQ